MGRAIVVVRMGRAWRYRSRRGMALVDRRFVPCCGGVLWSPAAGESFGVVAIPAGLRPARSPGEWGKEVVVRRDGAIARPVAWGAGARVRRAASPALRRAAGLLIREHVT